MLRASRRWPRTATPLLAATLMATGAMATPAAAESHRTIVVNSTADTVDDAPGDGDCADVSGECTLRAAVMEADADTVDTDIVIQVPAGTYALTVDGNSASGADGDLYLSDTAKPGDTTYSIVGTGGTPVIDATGLDGDGTTERILRIDDTDGNGRVLEVTLSSLALTGGHATEANTNGGAVLVRGDTAVAPQTTVLVEGVHAHDNQAGYYGGAVASFNAELTITDSVLEDNDASDGGAIYTGSQQLSVLTVRGSELRNNTAVEGGGIWASEGDVVSVEDSTFSQNLAVSEEFGVDPQGGAIWIRGSNLEVTGSTFDSNRTSGDGGEGGAVYNDGGTMSIEDGAFTGNLATCDGDCWAEGGAIWTTDGPATAYIAGSSFVDNVATIAGGGLQVDGDDVYVTNSTFVGNEAAGGGAINTNGGEVTLARVTVARNHATADNELVGHGGGIRVDGSSNAILRNVVVAENTLVDDTIENCWSDADTATVTSEGHNVSDDATCALDGEGDQPEVDARLGVLDASGDTDVIPLLPDSPAIDIGTTWPTANQCPVASEGHGDELDQDQRDEPAPVDGDADGSNACDAGAFEFQPNVVTVAATSDGSEAGATDGSVTLARTGDDLSALTVDYTITGTAAPDGDYTALSGTATFAASATSTVVPVEVIDDDEVEDDETVELTLTAGEGYLVGSPGSGTVTIADDEADRVQRLDGGDRIDTAVLVSQRSFPDGSDVVVIARSDLYADALAGGPFAHQVEAPILVTPPSQLRDEVATEIDRLGATEVVILGGPIAITPEVEDQIANELGLATSRLAGPDRFATAADIADEIGGDHVYVTEGDNPDPNRGWPDAVSVAPVAAHQNHPILFVRSDVLPEPTRAQIDEQAPSTATVIGGELAVSADVASQVDALVGDLDRVGGATRYHTSTAVAELGLAAGLSTRTLWVARSDGWVDALVAGPAVARAGDSFVLVPPTDLDVAPEIRNWISDHADTITEIMITGGPVAVSDLVAQQLADLLE